ncbi:MAG: hypothetical protein HY062_14735 [Bacteroidetes bacterium]|nr:hypothetical protein [Bacteroidota bacterium]
MTTYFGSSSYALLPALAILTAVLNVFKKRVSKVFTDTLHIFAIGSILSVVVVKLMPAVIRQHRTLETCVGIGLGIIAMTLITHFFDKQNYKLENVRPKDSRWKAVLIIIAIHLSVDGLALGIGFSFGKVEGILLATAMALEAFSLGLTVIEICKEEERSSKKTILYLSLLSILFIVTATIILLLLPQLPERWMKIILPFGATLLFTKVLTSEVRESKVYRNTTLLAIGFAVFLIIGLLV